MALPDLNTISLFEGLDAVTLESLRKHLKRVTVNKGATVLAQGAVPAHLFFLVSGCLQAISAPSSERVGRVGRISPGEFFGDLSLVDGRPSGATVVARERSTLLLLPREPALELMYAHPMVAERMIRRLVGRLRVASDQQTVLSMPSAVQRVLALLQQHSKEAPGGVIVIEKLPTQQEMATLANTSRETVSRAINALIQKGVVEKKDLRCLVVRAPDQFREAVVSMANEDAGAAK